ncbi:MAG: hypothetical protein O3C43_23970 [Verrucomicrobia bacterium]|nr:hypothetical protein [Verrucomicrobiota bacterium]
MATVFPHGSDGLVDLESVSSAAAPGLSNFVTIDFPTIAHGPPSNLFGTSETQTTAPIVGGIIRSLLQKSADDGSFHSYLNPPPKSGFHIRNIEEAARDVPASNVLAIVRSIPDQVQQKASGNTLPTRHASEGPLREFAFEFNPPASQPITGEVTWSVELHGIEGVSRDGVFAEPDIANPSAVKVSVDPSVIGDVVLFMSYETSGGKIAFGRPILVTSQAPFGAVLDHLEVLPDGVTVLPGEIIRPDIVAVYDDGSRVTKWYTLEDIESVVSSNPEMVSVAQQPDWLALESGSATITVNAFGMTAQSEITVQPATPTLGYEAWKTQFFSETELADSSVSGSSVDGDGDSLGLFLEFITGGHPNIQNFSHVPRIASLDTGEGSRKVFQLRISTKTEGETVTIQRSMNLDNWDDILTIGNELNLSNPDIVDYIEGESYIELFLKIDSLSSTFFRVFIESETL